MNSKNKTTTEERSMNRSSLKKALDELYPSNVVNANIKVPAPSYVYEGTYSIPQLESLPSLSEGHTDNLKIEYADTRVWLSRCTVEDGEPYDYKVTVERIQDGCWMTHRQYPARPAATRSPDQTRRLLERLAWKHTHRDFKGKPDGTKSFLMMAPTGGSTIRPIDELTNIELLAKIPVAVRLEKDL